MIPSGGEIFDVAAAEYAPSLFLRRHLQAVPLTPEKVVVSSDSSGGPLGVTGLLVNLAAPNARGIG